MRAKCLRRARVALRPRPPLVPTDVPDGVQHVVGLRKDFLLEVRGVRHRTVEGRDPTDRRVEMVEELVSDAGGNLRAEPARQLILVGDDHAIRLLDELADACPVVRDQRAQIEDRDAQAFLCRST